MIDATARGFDRRTILAAGSALLGGCATCAVPPPLGALGSDEMEIGDGHAHLFNAADLPVAGFLENVLLPTYLSAWEPLWPALLDLSQLVKALALPASKEIERLEHPDFVDQPADVPPHQFSDVIADHIEARVAAGGNAPLALQGRETPLADSHALLALLLAEARALQLGVAGPLAVSKGRGDNPPAYAGKVDRVFIARVALAGSKAVVAPVDPSPLWPGLLPSAEALRQLPSLWDGVKFLYALVQPRCSHVRQYLKSMASSETRTVRLINLLVDYDLWVGDGAAAGSGTVEQLKFWTEYRSRALSRVAIETFAPYDPLRHAEDRLSKGHGDGYFAQLRSWAEGTSPGIHIAGFKLYPPMGFKAKGNQGKPRDERAGAIIRRRWAGKWPLDAFGRELEASLDIFFRFCGEKGVPILAHARNSNEASPAAGNDANPRYWLDRARSESHPLKICLAHFSAEDPPRQWGSAIYDDVLKSNQAGRSHIYFDLAFADELLEGKARPLMEQVAALCAESDPECRWFLFGTDWIMLAQLHKIERYIPELLKAARKVPFWSEQPGRLQNLLHHNLNRFLERP